MKLPTKFPAKGWRKVRIGQIILKNDAWSFGRLTNCGPFFVIACIGDKLTGSTPLYRKIKTKKSKGKK